MEVWHLLEPAETDRRGLTRYAGSMSVLVQAWDTVAEGYARYWQPRFRPWVLDAVEALGPLPPGPIAVPCCGTGAELQELAKRYPGRALVGIDLSPGMVAVARRSVPPTVRLVVADAAALPDRWAGVVSCFGLQQLPDPAGALRSWCRSLLPGGRLVVALWTPEIADGGPYDALRDPTRRIFGRSTQTWSETLHTAIAPPAIRVSDDLVPHAISHEGPESFWDAMVSDGPWLPRLLRSPDQTAALRAAFLGQWPPGPFVHTPHARVLVAETPVSQPGAARPSLGR